MFRKILVANRGEIAVRVIRACREMGIRSAAVYSDADQDALHVRHADEAYYAGPSTASQSYLDIGKLIEICRRSHADAVHPGYGFLAENAEFVRACEKEKIVFIGPDSRCVDLLGDKIASKKAMRKAGIPVIPGSEGAVRTPEDAQRIAAETGFPVLIKAAGGGGGKGMRVVSDKKDLAAAMKQASSEARSAFNDSTIFIEKYLERPRHVEFQILADEHGNAVHLFERECSVQRRHQKMIEESPSPIMDDVLRSKMGSAAVEAVKVSRYSNAGTVEFMVDKDRNFYFLEMNTRLQVEHPVTELITGIDIVKEQFRIAAGERLRFDQDAIKREGCAIECRISAEDPENGFVPSTGRITALVEPAGIGVRVDSGVYEGFDVPVYYDPLIAKLLVWAPTRSEAIARMMRALKEYMVAGVKTTIPFHTLVMVHPAFAAGDYDTTFADAVLKGAAYEKGDHKIAAIAAALARALARRVEPRESTVDPWKQAGRQSMMR